MGFLLSEKTYFQIPYLCRTENCFRLQRSTGPVDRVWSRSTGSVDRRAQTCTPSCTGERSTGSVDRFRELCSLEISADRSGRPTESLLSAPVARSTGTVDRRLQRSDFWPLAVDRPGRPVVLTDPNGQIFLTSINWDFDLILHFLSFTRDFPISFSLLLVFKNT